MGVDRTSSFPWFAPVPDFAFASSLLFCVVVSLWSASLLLRLPARVVRVSHLALLRSIPVLPRSSSSGCFLFCIAAHPAYVPKRKKKRLNASDREMGRHMYQKLFRVRYCCATAFGVRARTALRPFVWIMLTTPRRGVSLPAIVVSFDASSTCCQQASSLTHPHLLGPCVSECTGAHVRHRGGDHGRRGLPAAAEPAAPRVAVSSALFVAPVHLNLTSG